MLADLEGKRSIVFKVNQVQPANELTGLFKMPVVFEVHYTDGTADRQTAWVEKKNTEVVFPGQGDKKVDFLLFDPGRRILKKVTFTRPFDQLAAQALQAENMIDRYDACVALRTTPTATKEDLLEKLFRQEKFWLVKSEILEQLGPAHSPEVVEVFREALLDQDANVRKSALKNLAPVPDLLQNTVEAMLQDSSYLNVELALGSLCLSFPRQTDHYLDLSKGFEGWRGRNIRMKWLELAINSGKKEFLPELVAYTGPGYEFETRMNAFTLLKKLQYADAVTRRNAEDASKHWNNKLSSVAADYLK